MIFPRIITGLVGIPLLLFLIYHGGLAYSAFVVTVCALCLYEYGVILTLGRQPVRGWLCVLGGGAMAAFVVLGFAVQLPFALLALTAILLEMSARESSIERLALTVFGACLFGIMPAYLGPIRDSGVAGKDATFLLFICVWVMDIAAYAIGKALGAHPLAPVLSPKKTWEGAAAGFLAALAASAIFSAFDGGRVPMDEAMVLGVLVGVFGQLSDLAESLIKRAVGVKDSGAVLPGHGGIMDRFDSFLLAAPLFYYCLIVFGLGK
ncbi:MAG TPA: phosphatidate cytidylyltransferase [Elusimicrobiota bacterium]|nr:phosphatidate cytidylyltransferase [Elusimicrobiota bacterium]